MKRPVKKAGSRNPTGTPADPTIEFHVIEIGGKKWSLCYSFYAIALAEAAIGRNLLSAFGQMMISISEFKADVPWHLTAADLLGLFHASLLTAHPDMTVQGAAQLIGASTFGDIHAGVGKAFALSMPEKEPGNPPAAGAAAT